MGAGADELILDDAGIAEHVAMLAATRLLEIRAQSAGISPAEVKDIADRGAQELIAERLAVLAPEDAVLSEEGTDDDARLSAPRVWIVDPLDGTREFAEGRDDWAVHIALVENGELRLGAVACGGPARVLTSSRVAPASSRAEGRALRIAVSRTRPPALVTGVATALGADLVPMGSAGVKICAVVDGIADAYIHGGGQYEWDSAAPVAVALAAGLHASRLDGSPLRYNQPNPYLPDLVVCRPEAADRVLGAIAEALAHDAE